MKDPLPEVFSIMAEFKSYEIQNWLDTTTPAHARALFELGAKLEEQRHELLTALQCMVDVFNVTEIDDTKAFLVIEKARAAISKANTAYVHPH